MSPSPFFVLGRGTGERAKRLIGAALDAISPRRATALLGTVGVMVIISMALIGLSAGTYLLQTPVAASAT